MKYVIIGTGVAGIAAIEAIRSVDAAGEITMIGDDPHGYYSRPGLAYFLTGEVNDKQLFHRTIISRVGLDDSRKNYYCPPSSRVGNNIKFFHSKNLNQLSRVLVQNG